MDIEKKKTELNQQVFKNLEEIRIGDALYYLIMLEERYYKGQVSLIKVFLCVIREMFFSNVSQVEETENSKFLFVFSSDYSDRVTYLEWYKKIRNMCFPSSLIANIGRKVRIISLKRFGLVVSWYKTLRGVFTVKLSLYFLRHLIRGYDEYDFVRSLIQEKEIKGLCTLCDVHLVDSIITQWCNHNGIVTVTAQHGIFVAGPDFALSHSRYFLGHGQFALEQAALSGKKEGVFKVGMPQNIGAKLPKQIGKDNLAVVGVLFAGCSEALMSSDLRILEWVLECATVYNYKVIVKFHPGYEKETYQFDWSRVDKIYSQEISIEEFAKKVDFTVVNSSTVFLEMLMQMVPSVIYDESGKLYENAEELRIYDGNSFQNKIEEYLSRRDIFENNMLKIREYYSETEDVDGKYRKALVDIMESIK